MSRTFLQWLLPISALLLCMLSSTAFAQSVPDDPHAVVSGLLEGYKAFPFPESVLKSANYLFWSLATISLIWTMGTLLLQRADIGEFFLELFRFIVITGFFSWLLINASSPNPDEGFVNMIVNSFAKMSDAMPDGSGSLAAPANHIADTGLKIFNQVMEQSVDWKNSDALLAGSLSIMIVIALTLVAAQLVLVLVMAWILAYGGIFLLGFGGSRWTSSVAISYYKNVIAVGAALLSLALVIAVGRVFLDQMSGALTTEGIPVTFQALCAMLIVALIMAVLCIKIPGLLYTLVTGSQLGLLSGTASMAGTAIMTGGNHAMSSFARQSDGSKNTHVEGRRESVMEAYSKVSPGLYGGDTPYQAANFSNYGVHGSAVDAFAQSRRGSVFGVNDSHDVRVNNERLAHRSEAEYGASGNASKGQASSAADEAPEHRAKNPALTGSSASNNGRLPEGSGGSPSAHSADPAGTQLMESMAPQHVGHFSSTTQSDGGTTVGQAIEGMAPPQTNSLAGTIQSGGKIGATHTTTAVGQTAHSPYGIGPSTSKAGTHQQLAGDVPSSQSDIATPSPSARTGNSKGGFQPAILNSSDAQHTQASSVVGASSARSSTQPYADNKPRGNTTNTTTVNPNDEVAAFRDRKTPLDITRKDK